MTTTHLLVSDPAVAAVPVAECGNPLVDVRAAVGLRVDEQPRAHLERDARSSHAHVRAAVAERLAAAAAALPDGLALVLAEGYRSLRLQRGYYDAYLASLRAQHPDWSAERLRAAASRFVAPPDVAPHSTGGAVDVLLVDPQGRDVDLGSPLNASPEQTNGACETAFPLVDAAQRTGRAALVEAMTSAGFVNYPTEWWHWSYGDRYWAAATGAPAAVFGPTSL